MKVGNHILATFFVMLCAFVSTGQDKTLDSLKSILHASREDTNKVKAAVGLCTFYYRLGDAGQTLAYADSAFFLSKKISYKKGLADAYFFRSVGLWILNDIDATIKSDSQALNIYKEINDKQGMAQAYFTLGIACQYIDNWPDAIKNSYEAIKLYEEVGNRKQVAYCLQLVGFNYYVHDDFAQSYKAYSDALTIYKSLKKENYAAGCYIYIANIYRRQGRYSEAIQYDSIGLKFAIEQQDQQMIGNAYSALGDIIAELVRKNVDLRQNVQAKDSLEQALDHYYKALSYFKVELDSGGMGDTYQRLCEMNIRLRRYHDAKKFADSALLVAQRLRYKDNLRYSYLVQARLDSATGNYEHAFEVYKKYIDYRDSISNAEIVKRSAREQTQYEFDKKDAVAKAEQAKKDERSRRIRNLQYFVIIGILGVAVFLWMYSRQKQKAKVKIENAYAQLKSTQAQLVQSEKMASLGELTAGIAHEIQNPLNFVNNFSDVNAELIEELNQEASKGNMEEVKAIAKDIKGNEQKINHHGKRADAIVKGMLQHSRTNSGQKESTDINKLADEYLRLAYHGLRAKDKTFNAKFETNFDDNVSKVDIIPQDIGRVLLNLINNAFYAVAEKAASVKQHEGHEGNTKNTTQPYEPTVTVSTKGSSAKNAVLISVKDNGKGIPQGIVHKIFQPFFTTKPTGQGTGLGLSLAYDIVKAHGGEIQVETKENEGSEFIVQLPI